MRTKSFKCESDSDFGRIAEWLEKHQGIAITGAAQSQSTVGSRIQVSYSILYNEPSTKPASIKFKTFASVNDEAVNQWLAEKKVTEVVAYTMSESPNENSLQGAPRMRIILLYR